MKKILKIFIWFLLFWFLSFWLSLQAASSDTYSIYPTNISNVPNKAKLDAFLNKVLDTRKEFSSDSNYLVFLNKISEKLDSLSSSYWSNTQVKTMITYLKSWVNNIITLTKQNTDVDSFFCDLFWDCESTTPICPVYSLVSPPEWCNYVYEKDANWCDVPKLSCWGVCTKEYSPVCAKPPMPPCPDWMSCTQAFPALKTYWNKCEANSAKATIQYEWSCKTETTEPSCSWQYHAVFWPVWPLDINPNTTSCTASLNGKSAYEISWNKQKVATCACTWSDTISDTPLLTDITLSKSEWKIWETIWVNYSVWNDRTCDIFVVKTKEYLKQNLTSVSNLNINYTLKQLDINSSWYINLEMKCTNWSVKTRSIKVTDYTSTPSCSWTQPTWEWVFKRIDWIGWIQNTSWTYLENNWTYSWNDFGSTMCTWTCSVWYTRSWNTCLKSSAWFTWAETVTLWNTFPTYWNSACIEQNLYNVFWWLKKSSNPKWCAQLAWTNTCNNASVFRNFTANEWVSDTTVLTQASSWSFPAWNYEFFLMYWTEIRKVWSWSLKQCNTAKVLNQSDVSTFIDNTRRELNNDAAAFVKIALEVLKYEREWYTWLRQQVASHLWITTNDVTVYINAVISKWTWELYVESYADLQAAFNSNNLWLTKNSFWINHYEKYGRSEWRYFPQK